MKKLAFLLAIIVFFIPNLISKDPVHLYPEKKMKFKPLESGGNKIKHIDKEVYNLISN